MQNQNKTSERKEKEKKIIRKPAKNVNRKKSKSERCCYFIIKADFGECIAKVTENNKNNNTRAKKHTQQRCTNFDELID